MSASMSDDADELASPGPDVLFAALREASDDSQIGVAVTFVDRDPPEVILVNQGVAKITGYSTAELMQRPVWACFAPEELERLQTLREARLRGEAMPRVLTTTVVQKTGE